MPNYHNLPAQSTQTTFQLAFQNMLSTCKPVIRKIHFTCLSMVDELNIWLNCLPHANLEGTHSFFGVRLGTTLKTKITTAQD